MPWPGGLAAWDFSLTSRSAATAPTGGRRVSGGPSGSRRVEETVTQYRCPICGYVAEFEGDMPADYACPQCKCPGERFEKLTVAGSDADAAGKPAQPGDATPEGYAAEHVVGVGKLENVPADIVADLRANFEGECCEVGMYLAMARVAEREGYAEIGAYWEKAAFEEAGHAAKFAELLGDVVTDSTKKNLEMRVAAEKGATAGKADLARRAKEANLDAIHDTVHEMARDEARHGHAFEGLLKRYFG